MTAKVSTDRYASDRSSSAAEPVSKPRRLLVVAYYFPPCGGPATAASQRTLRMVKYLPKFGWEVVVLTLREDLYESAIEMDRSLLALIPESFMIRRTTRLRGGQALLRARRRLLDDIGSEPL